MAGRRVASSTQAQFPGRAVLRTIVQVGIPAFLALALLVPEIVQEIVKQFGEQLPEGFRLWLLGVAALLTGAAAVITRVMALPRAIEFARKYLPFLAPDKAPAGPQVPEENTPALRHVDSGPVVVTPPEDGSFGVALPERPDRNA